VSKRGNQNKPLKLSGAADGMGITAGPPKQATFDADKRQRDIESGTRYRIAQQRLGLAKWQMELAVECGLLGRKPDGLIEQNSLDQALNNLDAWMEELSGVEMLNATQAAAELGVSVAQFHRLRDLVVPPIQTCAAVPWKYGRTIQYWRRKDVRRLRWALAVDEGERELRKAARRIDPGEAEKRSASAKKAAQTRRAHAAEKDAACVWLEATGAGTSSHPLDVIAYAAAMHVAFCMNHGDLKAVYSNSQVVSLAAALRSMHLSPAESARMIFEDRPRLIAALAEVEKLPDPVLGIPLSRFVHMATEHGLMVLGRRFVTKEDFESAKHSAWLVEAVATHEARSKKKKNRNPGVV